MKNKSETNDLDKLFQMGKGKEPDCRKKDNECSDDKICNDKGKCVKKDCRKDVKICEKQNKVCNDKTGNCVSKPKTKKKKNRKN